MRVSKKLFCLLLPLVLLFIVTVPKQAVAVDSQRRLQNSSSGISWAMQAMAVLTGGIPVNGISMQGTVKFKINKTPARLHSAAKGWQPAGSTFPRSPAIGLK